MLLSLHFAVIVVPAELDPFIPLSLTALNSVDYNTCSVHHLENVSVFQWKGALQIV